MDLGAQKQPGHCGENDPERAGIRARGSGLSASYRHDDFS